MRAAAGMLVVIAVFLLAGCGGESSRPGNPEVYDAIANETNCERLQERFDIAAANHERDIARGRSDLAEASTGYMEAADERMREIGCYP